MHNATQTRSSFLDATVAQNLRDIRRSLDMTQDELATELGYSFGTRVSELERCRNSLTLERLEDLATRLGVDPIQLLHPQKLPLATTLKRKRGR